MMYGYPGETLESLHETVEFFKKVPYVGPIYFAITTALPGSELYDNCLKEGWIKDEDQYLESLAPGFTANEHTPLINFTKFSNGEFYKLKSETERKIFFEQIKRYPYNYIKTTFKRYLFGLRGRLQRLLSEGKL